MRSMSEIAAEISLRYSSTFSSLSDVLLTAPESLFRNSEFSMSSFECSSKIFDFSSKAFFRVVISLSTFSNLISTWFSFPLFLQCGTRIRKMQTRMKAIFLFSLFIFAQGAYGQKSSEAYFTSSGRYNFLPVTTAS